MKINAVINSEKRALDGLADIHVLHENGQDYQLDLPFRDLYQRCGVPSLRVLDLLVTASVCYVVDKTVARSSAENGWTRELEVSVPVSEPKAWSKVAGELAETLSFLTGDEWTMSFRKAEGELFEPPKGKPLPLQVDSGLKTVCLFSGGLDSLGGAIDLLSDAKNGKVLLIGHYDGAGPRSVQVRLAAELGISFLQQSFRRKYNSYADCTVDCNGNHGPLCGISSKLCSERLIYTRRLFSQKQSE